MVTISAVAAVLARFPPCMEEAEVAAEAAGSSLLLSTSITEDSLFWPPVSEGLNTAEVEPSEET